MVVDDHPMWRDAVERDLQAAGFDVVAVAADGHEALAGSRRRGPQVVVLDLQIPGPTASRSPPGAAARTRRRGC